MVLLLFFLWLNLNNWQLYGVEEYKYILMLHKTPANKALLPK